MSNDAWDSSSVTLDVNGVTSTHGSLTAETVKRAANDAGIRNVLSL